MQRCSPVGRQAGDFYFFFRPKSLFSGLPLLGFLLKSLSSTGAAGCSGPVTPPCQGTSVPGKGAWKTLVRLAGVLKSWSSRAGCSLITGWAR